MNIHKTLRPVIVLLGSLLLAACSSSEAGSGGSAELSTRSILLGDSETLTEATFDAEESFQQLLVPCMTAAGFEYFPIDVSAQRDQQSEIGNTASSPNDVPSLEQAEERGLGLSLLVESQVGNLVLEGSTDTADRDEYLASLTGSELEEYGMALSECEDQASSESGVDNIFTLIDEASQFSAEIGSRLQSDADFISLNEAWAACYVEAAPPDGLEASMPSEVMIALTDELSGLDVEAALNSGGLQTSAEWNAFKQREFDAALVVASCGESVSYSDSFRILQERIVDDVLSSNG